VSADVILPCLDECAALPWVLGRVPAGWHRQRVDNGSTDGSVALAHSLGAEVVTAPVQGYGAACSVGLQHSTAEVVVVLDCDASVDPAELPGLMEVVVRGELDLVVGRRVPAGPGTQP
jgi:glycosyltransferase involved in cell wall biosynthesis